MKTLEISEKLKNRKKVNALVIMLLLAALLIIVLLIY